MEMILNSVRIMDYDQVKEYAFGDDDSLTEKLAIGLLNPEDFKNLNLTPNTNLKVESVFGNVVIKPLQDENVPSGIINMPVSIWANQITGFVNNEIIYKNIKVTVEVTKDSVNKVKDLLKSIK